MKILTKTVQTEINIKGSRFLTELFPCTSQGGARDIIKSQKEKYQDATHVVHAFVIGKSAEVMGMSDDGEPSGTSGRPSLDVLKGSGVTDFVLTTTRWFGGTLLGTGGLVKAYGGAAKEVLKKAEEEGAVTEYIPQRAFAFRCDYGLYKSVRHVLEEFNISGLKENYGEAVEVSGKIEEAQYDGLASRIRDLSKGSLILQPQSQWDCE